MDSRYYKMIRTDDDALIFYEIDKVKQESKGLLIIEKPTKAEGTISVTTMMSLKVFKDISEMLGHCLAIFQGIEDFPRITEFSCNESGKLIIDNISFWSNEYADS